MYLSCEKEHVGQRFCVKLYFVFYSFHSVGRATVKSKEKLTALKSSFYKEEFSWLFNRSSYAGVKTTQAWRGTTASQAFYQMLEQAQQVSKNGSANSPQMYSS